MKNVILVLALAFPVAGCGDQVEQQATETAETTSTPATTQSAAVPLDESGTWRGTVAETMDGGGYTYVLLDTGSEQRWVAGPTTTVAVGDKVAMQPGMLMRDFPSKSLDRTFAEIYFVGGIELGNGQGTAPGADPHTGMDMGGDASSHTTLENAGVEGVEKLAGGVTIAEIYGGAGDLAGQNVKLRARVVKFTPNIMGTNWAHLQDGTGAEGTHDLTVTTAAVLQVGDLVVVEGALTIDKDFGAGYRYAVIIEGADVTKE